MKLLKIIITFIIIIFIISCDKQIDFNSDSWKNWEETEKHPNLRWQMHKSLLKEYKLKTFNKDQIIELLGEPNYKKVSEYRYFLGSSNKGINTGALIIIFQNSFVTDIKVIEG